MPTIKYAPDIKVFYGQKDLAECRVIPSPTIAIDLQFNYSNDTIIGYTYIITLNGTITAMDLRNWDANTQTTTDTNNGIGAVIDHMYKLRAILSKNGSVLHVVKDVSGGTTDILQN